MAGRDTYRKTKSYSLLGWWQASPPIVEVGEKAAAKAVGASAPFPRAGS